MTLEGRDDEMMCTVLVPCMRAKIAVALDTFATLRPLPPLTHATLPRVVNGSLPAAPNR